jgi:hypothetical protein
MTIKTKIIMKTIMPIIIMTTFLPIIIISIPLPQIQTMILKTILKLMIQKKDEKIKKNILQIQPPDDMTQKKEIEKRDREKTSPTNYDPSLEREPKTKSCEPQPSLQEGPDSNEFHCGESHARSYDSVSFGSSSDRVPGISGWRLILVCPAREPLCQSRCL